MPANAPLMWQSHEASGKLADLEIGNLLLNSDEALGAAGEFARQSGQGTLANQIEEVRKIVSRIIFSTHQFLNKCTIENINCTAQVCDSKLITNAIVAITPAMRAVAISWFRMCLPGLRPAESRLLLCLLYNAGKIMDEHDLLELIGSRSPSSGLLRVLICRLRKGLRKISLEHAVETTQHGYQISIEHAGCLINALTRLETSEKFSGGHKLWLQSGVFSTEAIDQITPSK